LNDAKTKTVLAAGGKDFPGELRNVLSPLGVDIIGENKPEGIKKRCKSGAVTAAIFDDDAYRKNQGLRLRVLKALQGSKKDFITVSSRKALSAAREARGFGASDFIHKPYNHREFISRFNAVTQRKMRLTCIGGGTGLFHILMGFKKLPNVLLTSVVSMSDDGGSSGRLRASFGILPPGDIRRSLVALSNAPETVNQLMLYRFRGGESLGGHNIGNLFLTALADIKGSLAEGVRAVSDILNIRGIVLPVTDTQTTLSARFEDNTVVKGESKIDQGIGRDPGLRVRKVWHTPETRCTIEAFSSILNADIVTIGPGDLYTSIATNLLVGNIRSALSETKAKKVYICNLMTKPGETAHYTAFDHVKEIIKYMGGDYLDYVIISNTRLSGKAVREYARKDQSPVVAGDIQKIQRITKAKIITADVGHETELVRHDSVKIRNEVKKILRREKGHRQAKKNG
jgi:uncharacterized cofD-like protein